MTLPFSTRWLIRLLCLIALGYVSFIGVLYVAQRDLLYATDDKGGLKAARGIAIVGSERVALRTRDGVDIAGWHVPPKRGKPVFLFLHGKGGNLERKKWRWRRIRKAGWGILAISYRGYPGSTGMPSEAGLIVDGETAFAWLRARYRPDQIVLHGLSLGTGVAVVLATRFKARALILEAPYTAVVDVAAERFPFIPVRWLMHDTYLSRERINGIKMPVLIAHGTGDTVIPFAHGKRLFELAPHPKVFVAMKGSDHSTLVRDGLYPHIRRFLATY